MSKQPDPELADDENPEWTDETFAKAKPASEVLPAGVMAAARRKPGRPSVSNPKQQVTLRLSPEVIEHFKAGGKGWQTRIDDVLKREVAGRRE